MGMSKALLPSALAMLVVAGAAGFVGRRAAVDRQAPVAVGNAPGAVADRPERAGDAASTPPVARSRPRPSPNAGDPPPARADTAGLSVGIIVPGKASLGEPAPPFSLVTPDDDIIALAEFRGRPIVLNFFATWCAPCRAEMPMLQRAHEAHGGDLAVVGIDLREGPELVAPFLAELGLTFPVGLDRHGAVSEAYRVGTVPMTYFIDADGDVATSRVGVFTSEAELEAALRQILPPKAAP